MHATFIKVIGGETQIVTGERPVHTAPHGAKVRVLGPGNWPMVAAVLPPDDAPYTVTYDGETAPFA